MSVIRTALSRRGFVALGGLVAASSVAACGRDQPAAPPVARTHAATPEDARRRLEEGNSRFASGTAAHPRQGTAAREAVAVHQHPWALVHGCVDSRVSPELVFDQGIGDVFTTRTAGAVLDDTIVGSMEFAVGAPYAVPLVVILGHTGCGAVTGTVRALAAARGGRPQAPGEVIDIVREIAPVARSVQPHADEAQHVDAVVRANTRAVAAALLERSAIVREAVASGRTRVVPAVYDLATGTVAWLPAAT